MNTLKKSVIVKYEFIKKKEGPYKQRKYVFLILWGYLVHYYSLIKRQKKTFRKGGLYVAFSVIEIYFLQLRCEN